MKLDTYEPYDIVLSEKIYSNVGSKREDSYDEYDDNVPSYSKYGGYNGYDDFTIDAAFEGLPEATWNID